MNDIKVLAIYHGWLIFISLMTVLLLIRFTNIPFNECYAGLLFAGFYIMYVMIEMIVKDAMFPIGTMYKIIKEDD